MKYLVLVCGDRYWDDVHMVERELDELLRIHRSRLVIIQGCARGADTIARNWSEKRGVECHDFPADWNKYGDPAGPIRNIEMLNKKPNVVVAFHGDIKNSSGTRHCILEANNRGIRVLLISKPKKEKIKECTISKFEEELF